MRFEGLCKSQMTYDNKNYTFKTMNYDYGNISFNLYIKTISYLHKISIHNLFGTPMQINLKNG